MSMKTSVPSLRGARAKRVQRSNLFFIFVDCHDFAIAKSRNDGVGVDCFGDSTNRTRNDGAVRRIVELRIESHKGR